MARKTDGTPNRKDHVTMATGGHVARHAKRVTEVLEVRQEKVSQEIEKRVDTANAKRAKEVADAKARVEKEKKLEKATGDIKEEPKKGLAKASPNVREVQPNKPASDEERDRAVAEATKKVADEEQDEE